MNNKITVLFCLAVVSCLSLFSIKIVNAAEYEQAKRLRTLFTTPLERKKLDELRNKGQFDVNRQTEDDGTVIRPPLTVEVKGLVLRDNKKPVVWVNEGNTLKSQKIEDGVRVRSSAVNRNNLKIPVKVYQKHLTMKPGQQWTETDGKIRDIYQIKQPEIGTSETEFNGETQDNQKPTD